MFTRASSLLFAIALAGCVSSHRTVYVPTVAVVPAGGPITPMQAVFAAAEHPEGVSGTFEMDVRSGGRQDDWLYLNSEADYRDQRCLTVESPPALALQLERRLGGDPTAILRGKTVRVIGTALRTKIWFVSNGLPTDKYYYQTHVRLLGLGMLSVMP